MLSVAFRKKFANDLTDPGRAFGLYTFVAATDVLGTRLAIDTHHTPALEHLPIIEKIGDIESSIALGVWTVTLIAMLLTWWSPSDWDAGFRGPRPRKVTNFATLAGRLTALQLTAYECVRICWTYDIDALETGTWPCGF